MTTMPFAEMETAYELLATAIDRAGADGEALFLTRLALLLAHDIGELSRFQNAVAAALAGMETDAAGTTSSGSALHQHSAAP